MGYTKPTVTIDMEEYNDLKRIEKDMNESNHRDAQLYNEALTYAIQSMKHFGDPIIRIEKENSIVSVFEYVDDNKKHSYNFAIERK